MQDTESTSRKQGIAASEMITFISGIVIFVLGAAIGSFLNVCIYRLPKSLSIFYPSSFCPSCKRPIRWFDNIPLVSYWILKGRCRICHKKISIEYFWVELIHATLYAILAFRFFENPASISRFSFYLPFIFTTFLFLIAFLDFKYRIIFEDINNLGLAFFLIFSSFNPWCSDIWTSLSGYAVGSIFLTAIEWIGCLIFQREAMGRGDICFTAAIGAFLGWKTLGVALATAFILGGFVALVLILLKIKKKSDLIPFAPFLSAGAFVAIII